MPPAQPDPAKLEKVTLQLKWLHQFQFAGYYAALDQGYYREEGLDVTILPGGPGIDVDKEVLTGRADYGVLASELVVKYSQNEPLTALAPIIQHSIRALMVRKDAGINTLSDLQGKKIALTMNENPEILAMFLSEGIRLEDLQIEAQNATSEQRFLEGKIDAVVGSIANQPYQFRLNGVEVNTFRPINYGVDFYGDTLFTTQQKVKSNPAQVSKFLRASLRGWEYAFAHPQTVTDLILADYAPNKKREQLLFEANVLKSLTEPTLVEIGHQNPGRWQRIADIYAQLKLIQPVQQWQGFIYDPAPKADLRWAYWGSGVLLAAMLLLGWILFWNTRLRQQVTLRTAELEAKNALLQEEIHERQLAEEQVRQLNEVLETRVKERTAQLEEANRELSSFAYSVSHDLKAPLRHIQGYIHFLEEDFGDLVQNQAGEYLKRIISASTQMENLIDQLLKLSRASQVELQIAAMDAAPLARDIAETLQSTNPERAVEWIFPQHLPIQADAALMQIVLTNLLQNAWKFTAQRSPARIELGQKQNGSENILFVQDNGAGFDPEFTNRLFKPFQRLHRQSEFEGSGIGLATVQRIITRHQGKVWIEGRPQQGCTVYFTLGGEPRPFEQNQ